MKEVEVRSKMKELWIRFTSNLFITFLPAILYSIIFYIPTALSLLESYQSGGQIYLDIVVAFLCVYFIFSICAFSRTAVYFCVSLFYACGSSYIYFIINFKSPLNFSAMKFVSYQNRVESALNMFSMQGALLGLVSALIGINVLQRSTILWDKYSKLQVKAAESIASKLLVFSGLLSLAIFFHTNRSYEFLNQYTPYSIFKYFIVNTKDRLTKSIVQRNDISRRYDFKYNNDEGPTNIIIMLGESMVKDHLSISGYKRRRNMPRLEGVKNLLSLSNYGHKEEISLADMFLRRPCTRKGRRPIQESSVISVFRRLGFRTTVISSHTRAYEQELKMTSIFTEAEKVLYRSMAASAVNIDSNSFMDHNTLDVMKKEMQKHKERSHMMVISMMGNRWPYYSLYPRQFAKFHPECASPVPSNCSVFEVRNSYHNSIVYVDYMINEAIEYLKDKNSIIFYISNQGKEFEGLLRRYKESDYTKETNDNAILVWVSDKFLEKHGDSWRNISAQEDKPVSIENIFHTVLGCIDVESDAIDPSLNLCAAKSPKKYSKGA